MAHCLIILLLAPIQREGGNAKRAKLDPESNTTVSYNNYYDTFKLQ